MSNIEISVIIPTKNRRDSLKKTLTSLKNQTFKNFEVIISDGGSTDGSLEMIEGFRDKLRITNADGRGGLVAAMNNAARKCRGKIMVRTDDDVVASAGWLKNVFETFKNNPKIGGVTGPTVIPKKFIKSRDLFSNQEKFTKGSILWRVIGRIYNNYFMEREPRRVSHWFKCGAFSIGSNYQECTKIKDNKEVDNLEACNYSIRKKLFDKTGCFDLMYSGVGEYHEPDVSFKIMKLGFKLVFNPKAIVYHCPVQTGIYNARPKSFSRAQNFVNFYFRHIKPDTFDKFVRFHLYLLFINCFWFYKFLKSKNYRELGAIPGTVSTLIKNYLKLLKT